MRAIEIAKFGGPEGLILAEREIPKPGPGQVLIAVDAAGINRPDVLQRRGLYPPPHDASDIPGLEVAGTIAALGDGVDEWRPGDSVCALVTGGGYADYCLAAVQCCLPIPDRLTAQEAAALPETFFTVWANVFELAHLEAGETLLVHGGTSGIGTVAIQLAASFGATVIATAGSDQKVDMCRNLGAHLAINYKSQDFVTVIEQNLGTESVDVVLDMVGGDYVAKNIDLLANDGRHVSIAFLTGAKPQVNLAKIMAKRLTLTGSTLRPRKNGYKGMLCEALSLFVWPLLDTGEIAPVIDSIYDLEDAPKAHERMESGQHMGKIILRT